MSQSRTLRSDIAWSTPDRIGVWGYDLTRELIGRVNLGDMGFLEITGRLPDRRESTMFNALLVTLVEHGIVPSTLAARMTVAGAPEALQAAVAAGLLGLGSVFVGSTEAAARLLKDALPDPTADVPLREVAARIVDDYRAAGRILPGLGHPIHKPIDPRTPRLFAIAKAQGFAGRYIELMKLIARRAEESFQAAADQRHRGDWRHRLRDGAAVAGLPRHRRHGARGWSRGPRTGGAPAARHRGVAPNRGRGERGSRGQRAR
jgi:citrate synthase